MGNIINYVENKWDTFSDTSFNRVDSLILSQFSYSCFDDMVPKISEFPNCLRISDLFKAENFNKMVANVYKPNENKKLLFALASSPRFRDIKMCCYTNQIDSNTEKQFSAVTFFIDENTSYIAFRGTDNTFVGWKENFNMAFIMPVPSQTEAVRYIEAVANKIFGNIIVGGHSKGGNLAVYAAMMCAHEIQDRIVAVYTHDGPGFKDNVFESMEYKLINEKIYKTLPHSSLVGMILENQEDYSIVESNTFGFMQHDPFSWIVKDGDFCVTEELSSGARYVNKTLNDWITNLSPEKREQLTDVLYSVFSSTDASSFIQLNENKAKEIKAIIAATKNIDTETRNSIFQMLKGLAKLAVSNVSYPLKGNFFKS